MFSANFRGGRLALAVSLASLATVLACAVIGPNRASAAPLDGTGFGLADPVYGQTLNEKFFARLSPKIYRVQVPYDLITCSPSMADDLENRLRRVKELGVVHILATFTRSCRDINGPPPGERWIMPPDQDWVAGVDRVMARFTPWVDAWSPVNEPNDPGGWFGPSIETGGPETTARWFRLLSARILPGDEIVSPEFITQANRNTGALDMYDGQPAQTVFIQRYLAELAPYGVNGWGAHAAFHPYDAVTSTSLLPFTKLRDLVPQGIDIWLTEIGARVYSGSRPQADQVRDLAAMAQDPSNRIARAYYYNLSEGGSNTWDSALLDDVGVPRPSWSIWCNKARYFPNGSAAPCGSAIDPQGISTGPSEDYHVWRSQPDAGWINTPQVAERVVAKEGYIRSASFNIGNSPDGRVKISVYGDPAQTQLLGSKIVNVSAYGESTANFDPAIPVTPGQPYYLQAMAPTGGGSLQVYYSIYYDDYRFITTNTAYPGGAQYNWGSWGGSSFAGPNVNSRVTTSMDNAREIYSVSRIPSQSSTTSQNEVAEKFTATLPSITSASVRVTPGPSGKVTFAVWQNAAQTQIVPGSIKTVTANPDPTKNTTVTFDTPLSVIPGYKYYLQVTGVNGESFTATRSTRNDYLNGGGQYGWDNNGFTGPDVIGRIVGTTNTSTDTYWVWRYEPEANAISTPQATQQFRATNSTIRSVSLNVGSTPNGQVKVALYRNKAQTDYVAGSQATVAITPYGETKVTYSTPVAVTPGQMYYLQVIHPTVAPGNLVLYRSGYDDYGEGGAQYNWDANDFTGYDLNARVVSGP